MNLTVEEALSIFPFSKAKLIAGEEGRARTIRAINTMDAPDVANWIKPGELLLTTAYAVKDAPDELLELLKKLHERDAAGIGIKLGRYWSQIPQLVLDEANRLQFPVLELPYEFAFSEQMNALFHAEYEKSTKKLHDALEKQMRLVRFTLHTHDFSDPFQTISDILGHSIVVFSSKGQILFNNSDWPEVQLTRQWPWTPVFHKERTQHGWFCRIPLMKEQECYGFLLVIPNEGGIHADEEGLYHQAAEVLCYHMDLMQDGQHTVLSYQWSVITERYLKGSLSRESFVEQAHALGSQLLNGPSVCVLLVPAALPETEAAPYIAEWLRELRREISYHPILGTLPGHHVEIDDNLLYVFKAQEAGPGYEAFAGLLVTCFNEVVSSLGRKEARCYISKPKHDISSIREAYGECLEAQRISRYLEDDKPVILFANLEFSYLFSYIPEEAKLKYCRNLLQPLLQRDEEHIADAFVTLETFFACEGQINEAAKQLFIHRNTMQYRLEKLGELLGLDLRKLSDVMKLKMMLMFKDLIFPKASRLAPIPGKEHTPPREK
ncbi:PucR family transcriptional regulator ligand-binding domain-containing protein [Paenibacillus sp. IB182496]|uniref:PucR family transcriptional regulator ligand-binding domain-containing protein n=1 Tax=Paenibacillus sabuli TaxID=2772509 RepID=A0A927GQK5_9BACL|nr:PucR family transcriptional regulator ligand-binding domain-containing protein [Paenibacillus sabuli]MBD2843990.1 PucR family transcriptional regulator ligand-binding domain-containing protein [Paenibacillus sabuli]